MASSLAYQGFGAYLRCRRFWKYSVGSGRLKSDPRNDGQKNGYLVVLPVKAHGVESYTSTAGNTVVKYTAK